MALKLCTEFSIGDEARSRGVDLFKTLSVYNLRHWFDGSTAKIVLDLDIPVVALVNVDGYTKIFASNCKEIDLYVKKLLWSLGIYEDISSFQSIASRDPLLSRFSIEWSGWRLRSSDLWWALVIGVCQQNASFRQGWSMVINIVDIYGRVVELENNGDVVLPPHPGDIVRDPSRLIDTGVGYRAKTIESIARVFTEKRIPSIDDLQKMDSRDIEAVLRGIRGVGSYTARLAMTLALRRYELPPVDRWLKKIVSKVYGVDEKSAEDIWRDMWGMWSGLAAVALTIALDAAPLREALARIERGELLPKIDTGPSPATLWRYTAIVKRRICR